MIRLFFFSDGQVPAFFTRLVETSDEIQIVNGSNSSDVVLVYTHLWNRAAFDRIQHLLDEQPKPMVVACEEAEESFAKYTILHHEVSAVLKLSVTPEQFLAAIRAAAAGLQIVLNTGQTRPLKETTLLTPRELEVLRLIADGEGNKSIAHLLKISEHTVKFHISSIFEKLHVSSRTEAIRAGIMQGLVSI